MSNNDSEAVASIAELGRIPERWYCLSKDGMAMICKDERDARLQVTECDTLYPSHAPHKAALLGDLAAERERNAGWFALVMNAAADLEDAANCLRDKDAKQAAQGAAKHYRERANAMSNDIELDAWKCNGCNGDGWYWQEHQVAERKTDTQTLKTHCDECGGLGYCGPDAEAASTKQKQ